MLTDQLFPHVTNLTLKTINSLHLVISSFDHIRAWFRLTENYAHSSWSSSFYNKLLDHFSLSLYPIFAIRPGVNPSSSSYSSFNDTCMLYGLMCLKKDPNSFLMILLWQEEESECWWEQKELGSQLVRKFAEIHQLYQKVHAPLFEPVGENSWPAYSREGLQLSSYWQKGIS